MSPTTPEPTDDVLNLARALGKKISEDPRTRALRDAAAAVAANPDSKRLEEDYSRAAREMHEREEDGRPIEPDLKRSLLALSEQVRRSPALQALMKAHTDFGQLMDGVQRAIGAPVDAALGSPDKPKAP